MSLLAELGILVGRFLQICRADGAAAAFALAIKLKRDLIGRRSAIHAIVRSPAMTASDILALVETELTRISNPRTVSLIRGLLVPPHCEQRPWDYGELNETHPCWIVAEHPSSNTAFAYCEHGFGPRCPWGLLGRSGEWLNMGMDSSWFTSLEDCVRDSFAWPD